MRVSSSVRSRNFRLITYLDKLGIDLVVAMHLNQIKAYSAIYHDKDTWSFDDEKRDPNHKEGTFKEPHYHIVLCLYNATTVSAVKRWFYGFKDDDGQTVNTLGQVSKDINADYDYLTHTDFNSISLGKVIYNDDLIFGHNLSYFKGSYQCMFDTSQHIVEDMQNGTSYEIMWRRYGRDFILNFSKYKEFCDNLNLYGSYDKESDFIFECKIDRYSKNCVCLDDDN